MTESTPIFDRLAKEAEENSAILAYQERYLPLAEANPIGNFSIEEEDLQIFATSIVGALWTSLISSQETIVKNYGIQGQPIFNAGWESAVAVLIQTLRGVTSQ